eukprot:3032994-Prymnesium_polylepis.1
MQQKVAETGKLPIPAVSFGVPKREGTRGPALVPLCAVLFFLLRRCRGVHPERPMEEPPPRPPPTESTPLSLSLIHI